MPLIRTTFDPLRNGFGFRNAFVTTSRTQIAKFPVELWSKARAIIASTTGGSIVYGLAPGMCFAALDFYLASIDVREYVDVKKLPKQLLQYLWRRNWDASSRLVRAKTLRWMTHDDNTTTRLLADRELPNLCAEIERGYPIPLALIRSKGQEDPTANHCVLAVSYDVNPIEKTMTIHVYDPNHPGSIPVLLLSQIEPGGQVILKQSTGEHLYGFFVIPYKWRQPPIHRWYDSTKAGVETKYVWANVATESRGVWADSAIQKVEDDRFGYKAYAEVLAKRAVESETPLTIGIFGQWGSGKTSLMHLIDASLSTRVDQQTKVRDIWIDVWALGNQEEVWQAFLQALFSEVNRRLTLWQRVDRRKLARQLIANSYRIVLAITPLVIGVVLGVDNATWTDVAAFALQPFSGREVTTIGALLSYLLTLWVVFKPVYEKAREVATIDLKEVLKHSSFSIQISALMRLKEQFSNMVTSVVEDRGRLIVFIDDLDRCTPDKIPEVLEAIKLFATTKNCVYVLGLDHGIVLTGIRKHYRFDSDKAATNYLEKIIQVPFHLPPLDRGRVKAFIRDRYPELQVDCPQAPEVFSLGLEPNPRQVKRALNVYRTLVDLAYHRFLEWEIDYLEHELIAKMVVIQSRHRKLFEYLTEHPSFLLDLEENAIQSELGAASMMNDPKIGPILLRQTETKGGETQSGLIEVASLAALQSVLKSGEKRFNAQHQREQITSYLYLIAATEGGAERVHKGSKERQILLGGQRSEIDRRLSKILAREEGKKRDIIRQDYIERLRRVLSDYLHFSEAERKSARLAIDILEGRDQSLNSNRRGMMSESMPT